jgi:acetyl esterase/lipase
LRSRLGRCPKLELSFHSGVAMTMMQNPCARRPRESSRAPLPRFLLAALLGPGLLATPPAAAETPKSPYKVREVKNIAYWKGKGADAVRHRLDLYLPRDKKVFPVIVFVHGGIWMLGDKRFFGWGPDIGRYFAGQGIGAVFPSYRLSPGVKHPEHVKDVARAFAWVRKNIAGYGGDLGELFLCGHSAGGHLAALLATDPSYLKAEGVKQSAIKGVIAVSGVYRLPGFNFGVGAAPAAGRAPAGKKPSANPALLGWNFNPFSPIFGSDPKALLSASPLTHVRAGLAPFLILYADRDLPLLPGMARDFARALKKAGCEAEAVLVKERDHEDIMFKARSSGDPVARAILKFLADHAGKGRRRAPAEGSSAAK